MKKWRKKSVSMLLIVLMLVTSLGATAAPQPAEAAVSGQTIVNKAMEYCGKVPYVSGGTKLTGQILVLIARDSSAASMKNLASICGHTARNCENAAPTSGPI